MIRRLLLLSFVSLLLQACDCGKKPAAPSLLKEGEACENDERCETGLCDAAPGFTPVCVRRCGDTCFTTEVCVQLTPNRFACQPDQRKLCAPCVADSDCPYPSDHCITVNGENVCGRDCAFDQSCPTGYRCVNATGVDGLPKVQQCVPINASCACLARGDFMQPCETTNAFGTCSGIKECDLVSNAVVCSAGEPGAETCNGKDDDCDGQIDEGLVATTCGVGACERTVDACTDGGSAVCTPGMPSTETCNGIDDDCDGTVDNGFVLTSDVMNCGMCGRVCSANNATSSCTAGNCEFACNAGFENCNNMPGDGCEVNTTNDLMHCGACNAPCATRANSTVTCASSTCEYTCQPGWVDVNMNPADGCECNPSASDAPDLMFTDSNCDGIDGEINNAIFVSATTGNDANDGSRMSPVQTIGQGITLATGGGKRDVYVAAGTYTGPLTLSGINGLNIAGGYDPATWQRNLTTQVVTVQNANPALVIDGSSSVLVQGFKFVGSNGVAGNASAYGGKITESSAVRLEAVDVRAGNGLDGTNGAAQPTAASGNIGGSGAEGCYNDPRWDPFNNTAEFAACNTNLIFYFCSNARLGGAGGASSCGANGGAGGSPSLYSASGTPNGQAGVQGSPSGGAGGQGVPAGATPAVGSIYYGANGADGTAGNNGAGATVGTFNSSGFVPTAAGAGGSGTAGRGGGGGGGGAGGFGYVIPGYNGLQCYTYGSSGSGGGSGGCGGQGGGAGGSGGASIGLFLYNSQVTAQGAVIRSGNGGRGGNGGSGGGGGTGAAGGALDYDSQQGMATRAGGGGRGGNGGSGGHGGGGAGGSVYGIAKSSTSTWMPTGGSIQIGTAGAAGTSSGNAGVAGASGVQTTF